MYKISDKIINFTTNSMDNWGAEFIGGDPTVAEINYPKSFRKRLILAVAIYYINDDTQTQTYIIYRGLKSFKITRPVTFSHFKN